MSCYIDELFLHFVGFLFEYIAKPKAFENASTSGSLNSALNSVSSFATKTLVARLVVVFKIPIFGACSYRRFTIWALSSLMEQMILISRASFVFEDCIRWSMIPNSYSIINAFELGNNKSALLLTDFAKLT